MSTRARNPSVRALEAQRDAYQDTTTAAAATPRSRKPRASAAPPAVAPPARRGNAAIRGMPTRDDEDEDMSGPTLGEDEGEGDKDPDFTLYCICLGFDTGEQPMIQCEHCSNWFHFRCIGLDEASAAVIEAYCCDICREMGVGTTRTVNDAPLHPTGYDSHPSSPSLSGTFDDDEDLPEADNDDDEEYSAEAVSTSGGVKRAKKAAGGTRQRSRRKVANAEGDDEWVGDEPAEVEVKGRSRSRSKSAQPKPSTSKKPAAREGSFLDDAEAAPKPKGRAPRKPAPTAPPAPVDLASAPSAPPTDKTRTHCVNQLTTIFKSIFSATEAEGSSIGVEVRAAAFAESVEGELFDGFAELDPKGIRSPRTKYVAKFRSLHFNLKTNAGFRSRISSNDLTPAQIVNMSNEDLLTPELRAMADSVRAASLKHSVKEVTAAPKAKRTHKGEEEIDNPAALAAEAEDKAMEERERRQRERSDSQQQHSPAPSPRVEASPAFFASPSAESPAASPSTPFGTSTSSTARRHRPSLPTSNISITAEDLGIDIGDETPIPSSLPRRKSSTSAHPFDSASPVGGKVEGSPAPTGDEGAMAPPPPPASRARSSFDMSSIWGKVKQSPKLESPDAMETAVDGEGGGEASSSTQELESGSKEGAPESTTPPMESLERNDLAEIPRVWEGDVIVPDEGGFPSFGVQIGGRPFGTATSVWEQVLPGGLRMDGRIPTKTAQKYLLECSLASSRELVVVALLPDLTGPTDAAPQKSSKESCLVKHQHVVDFFVKKDRIGVVAPSGKLKKVVKDIYILPLRKWDAVPEWADLIDESRIPEPSEREGDILLGVIVVQKGVIPTYKQPEPAPAPTPSPAPVVVAVSAPEPAPALISATLPIVASTYTAPLASQPHPYTAPAPYAPPPSASPYPASNSYRAPPPFSASPYGGHSPYAPPPSSYREPPPHARGPPSSYGNQHSPAYPQHSPPYANDHRSPPYANDHRSPPYTGGRGGGGRQHSPPYNPPPPSNTSALDPATILNGIDTSALNSLLANPSLLQSALAQSQAPMTGGYAQQAPYQREQSYQAPPQQWGGGGGGGGHGGYQPTPQGYGGQYGSDTGGGSSGGGGGGAGYVHPSRAALLGGGEGGPPSGDEGYGGPSGGYGRGGAPQQRSSYERPTQQQQPGFGPPGGGWGRGRGR